MRFGRSGETLMQVTAISGMGPVVGDGAMIVAPNTLEFHQLVLGTLAPASNAPLADVPAAAPAVARPVASDAVLLPVALALVTLTDEPSVEMPPAKVLQVGTGSLRQSGDGQNPPAPPTLTNEPAVQRGAGPSRYDDASLVDAPPASEALQTRELSVADTAATAGLLPAEALSAAALLPVAVPAQVVELPTARDAAERAPSSTPIAATVSTSDIGQALTTGAREDRPRDAATAAPVGDRPSQLSADAPPAPVATARPPSNLTVVAIVPPSTRSTASPLEPSFARTALREPVAESEAARTDGSDHVADPRFPANSTIAVAPRVISLGSSALADTGASSVRPLLPTAAIRGRGPTLAETMALFVPIDRQPLAVEAASLSAPVAPPFELAATALATSPVLPQNAPGVLGTQPAAVLSLAPSPGGELPPVRAEYLARDTGIAIARHVTAGGTEVRLRIEPAELGRVDVRLTFDDRGLLRAVVAADSPIVLDLLRRDGAELGRAMADAGIRADQQSFRFETGGGDAGQSRQQRHAPGEASVPTERNEELAPQDFRPLRWRGQIDVMA